MSDKKPETASNSGPGITQNQPPIAEPTTEKPVVVDSGSGITQNQPPNAEPTTEKPKVDTGSDITQNQAKNEPNTTTHDQPEPNTTKEKPVVVADSGPGVPQNQAKDEPDTTEKKETEDTEKEESDEEDSVENQQALLQQLLKLLQLSEDTPLPPKPKNVTKILQSPTVENVAKLIKEGKCKNIIVMSGAGISVASGIPDFRSPGTGLYHNLQKYDLPYPQAIFELDYFREKPLPFYTLAKALFPGNYYATPCHYFIRLLQEKGLLLRCFTQNIDTLERVAGVQGDKMVEAHGSFATAHCISCSEAFTQEYVREAMLSDKVPICTSCKGTVKPDIVFFGEALPSRFFKLAGSDLPQCDLLIVMGTSLQVQPFASLIHQVNDECPRMLINREVVGQSLLGITPGFNFDGEGNYRDVKLLGDCQESIYSFVKLIGWEEEFNKLLKENKFSNIQMAKEK